MRSEENYRRMNNLNALLYRFFVWITACHGRVHEKWPKDTEETWIPTEEQRERAKSGFKTVFWALIGTNRDESAFLGRRAGRRVSVSKSGLSRRERDRWQVWVTVFCSAFLLMPLDTTQTLASTDEQRKEKRCLKSYNLCYLQCRQTKLNAT